MRLLAISSVRNTYTEHAYCILFLPTHTYTHTHRLANIPRTLYITAIGCEEWLGSMRVLLDFNCFFKQYRWAYRRNELVWVLAAHTNIITNFPPLARMYWEILSSVMKFHRTERSSFLFAVITNLSLSSGVQFIS